MPRTMAECRNPNSVMASYRTKSDELTRKPVMSCSYIPRSLREFPAKGPSSPEELFYPNSLTLEWVDLSVDGLTFWLARGAQSELLREITIAGPIVLVKPTETYRRCLSTGMVPFDSIPQDYTLDADKTLQREMLLSLCLEQRWTNFLVRCALEWSDGSAAFLYPEFLRWGVQRASELKLMVDQFCVPLFDQSGANIGETEANTLRFCGQQLECLTAVVSKLPSLESDLEKQKRALRRIATYLQVLLWFYDVGLLPETQELEEDDLPQMRLSMKIPYPKEKLVELYKKKRRRSTNEEGKEEEQEEVLFIDQLISETCLPIRDQWEREAGSESPNPEGQYPPPSLQSLLRSYLVDCFNEDQSNGNNDEDEIELAETKYKHCITIYLLMDLAMLLQGSHPNVERLIKYPSAFKLSPSLIKLTQAFWLLDHEDYEGFFKIVTGQLISTSDIKDWHHKLAIQSLLKNEQHKMALMYLRVLKPPLSTLNDQGTIIGLTVEQGLVESAFHSRPPSHYSQLLTGFFKACKANGKLKQILYMSLDNEEEEAFIKFLKENECEDIRLLYYLQRCRQTEAMDIFSLDKSIHFHSSTSNKISPVTLKMLGAFNSTLPEITKRFAMSLSKNTNNVPLSNRNFHQQSFIYPNSVVSNDARGYPRPMSHCRNLAQEIYEVAVSKTRETCLKNDRSGNSVNHLPFLGAPCSTIVYCTRASGNNVSETSDAVCVMFPEKKVTKGKRTHNMMSNEEEDTDNNADRKRRRLGSDSEANLSRGDGTLVRRLSMSQVCDTPLVQRKVQLTNGRDPNSLVSETPHSILKIRQMLRRNSNSSNFDYGNDSFNERENLMRRAGAGDVRPSRQIRFSVDRFGGNDDMNFSIDESNREDNERSGNNSVSSKIGEDESGMEEAYYSPNVSVKSLRDSSILTDTSITKCTRGPRPRPSLRRSSVSSHALSDYQSDKSSISENMTMDFTTLDTTPEKTKSKMNTSRSPSTPASLYSASILSSNTSAEGSPLKKQLTINNNERRGGDETAESEDQSETEEVGGETKVIDKDTSLEKIKKKLNTHASPSSPTSVYDVSILSDNTSTEVSPLKRPLISNNKRHEEDETEESEDQSEAEEVGGEINETDFDKDLTVEPTFVKDAGKEEETEEEELEEQCQDEEKAEEQQLSSSNKFNLPQENEISEDDDEEENDGQQAQDHTAVEEEEECDQEDTFQSFSNSFNESTSRKLSDHVHRESTYSYTRESYSSQRVSLRSYKNELDYSLTKNIFQDANKPESSYNEHEYHQSSYSLTKPIFIDSRGVVQCEEVADITDDESMDADIVKPGLVSVAKHEDEDETDITLNVSDRSEVSQKKDKEREVEVNKIEKEASPKSESSLSPGSSKGRRTTPLPRKAISEVRSRLSSFSSTKSDDLGEAETSRRQPTKHQLSVSPKELTSTRTSKIIPTIAVVKADESTESKTDDKKKEREKRSTSVTKEVKKILSKVIREPIAQSTIEKEKDLEIEQESHVSTSSESKSTRKPRISSRPPISKSPQDESLALHKEELSHDEETSTTKRSARAKRAGSVTKDAKIQADKPARRTRAASITEENVVESSMQSEETMEEPTKKKTGKARATRASSIAKDATVTAAPKKDEELNKIEESEESHEVEKPVKSRSTRASSLAKDTTKSSVTTRKTRGSSMAKEEEEIQEKPMTPARKTRAASVAKEEEPLTPGTRRRRASLAKEPIDEEPKTPIRRATRGSSLAKEISVEESQPATGRRTRRGSSVAKETIEEQEDTMGKRATRSSSVAKEISDKESEQISSKRATRGSSVAKETEELDETLSKRTTRKRGNSMPKEVPTVQEPTRLQSRGRRSTSLLKEVILEESFSQLDSPASSKRSRLPRYSEEPVISSPAANTRSRRSSIQLVPEELEETTKTPTKKGSAEVKDESRSRRASSVDSTVPKPAAKRVTRSVLTKTAIIEDVIPEETTATKSPESKKQSTRRKRATSVPVDAVEDPKEKEKAKPGAKPKRGRKASESKDFLFSPPEETGEMPEDNEAECRTPIYKFSEPTGLQKFISPVRGDLESFNMTTRCEKTDSEKTTSARIQRRPRTCFVLPKKMKDKAN